MLSCKGYLTNEKSNPPLLLLDYVEYAPCKEKSISFITGLVKVCHLKSYKTYMRDYVVE